jgi:phenylacetic acid degradation protein
MPCYSLDGLSPVVHPSAFVHPSAELIGDVWIGANVYIGPLASLRGDFGRIVVREGANVQDTCVMHAFPGKDCVVEVDGHIGHGAVLHGCTVGRNALVGMNSVVMDEVEIGESTIVAAGAFVRAGMKVPARSLLMGSPAKVVRELSDDEVRWKGQGTQVYQALARRCRASLVPVQPLTQADEGRPRFTPAQLTAGVSEAEMGLKPLVEVKRG